jgi:hypothetical protein
MDHKVCLRATMRLGLVVLAAICLLVWALDLHPPSAPLFAIVCVWVWAVGVLRWFLDDR